uniref:Kazal-like domain-containing protein n=1 Tax=Musca domestica TaxID=7370 RepID=A0A1I8N3I2_MUSDO
MNSYFFGLLLCGVILIATSWANPTDHNLAYSVIKSQESIPSVPTLNSCNSVCPRNLDPICAVDVDNDKNIKYFPNTCLMENDACRRGRVWKPTQLLQCAADIDPGLRDGCVHACPFNYDPICARTTKNGAEGKVHEYIQNFANRCVFDMENCLASGKWIEVRGEMCGLDED